MDLNNEIQLSSYKTKYVRDGRFLKEGYIYYNNYIL